jgi:hypothetical protein
LYTWNPGKIANEIVTILLIIEPLFES